METLYFRICVFLGLLAGAVIVALPLRRQFADFHEFVRRTPKWHRAFLALLAAVFIAYGSTKTNQVDQTSGTNVVEIVEGGETNAPPMMLMMAMPFYGDQPPTVTPADVACGWQLWEVRTNHNMSYAMPDGATLATNWWLRGAYEDVKPFGFGGWRFPFGTNEYSSLWAFSWGKVRFAFADTNTEIVAVGAPMSAVPYRSRLWFAADTNDSRFVIWENFALNRDTNTPVNAQVELRTTGDFVTRSNEVETVYRRVNPEDWDDDGWHNDDDPDPYVWEEYWDSFWQELPDGANESAYCWIEIRPRWNSYIEFYGDGSSNLDDPYLWAKAGKTYRVQLLIGKTYFIESTQPLDVVGRSSPSIEIDGNGTTEIEVVWPVSFTALEGNGASFMMRVVPSGLGGAFEWTQHCCAITGYGNQFWWAHERPCWCGGCYASGWYSYEGYALECTGGYCGCPHYDDDDPYESEEDDGPYAAGASVSFSESVVIFEDAYTNMPVEVVARQSTQTTLTCVAHGGETGGTATFSIENGDKLIACLGGSLPVTRFVPPLQKVEFEIVYEGKLPSGSEEDIIAKADFTERVTGTRHSTQRDWLTSVKVELEAEYDAPTNHCSNRHIYGVGEKIKLRHYPQSAGLNWRKGADDIWSALEDGSGCDKILKLHYLGGSVTEVIASCSSVEYRPTISVVEPQSVVCMEQNWDGTCSPLGVAGGFGMDLWLFIEPMYVSFQGIDVAEIPCETVIPPTGYYATTNFNGVSTHNIDAGAGYWHHISSGNYWCMDNAWSNVRRQQWSDGQLQWNIPIQWYQRLESGESWPRGFIHANGRLIGGSAGAYKQVFNISANGTVKITKHDHWIEWNTNDVIRLDGVEVHDGGHRR